MGTPGFAIPSLEAIINENYNVVGVVTAPDKPSGRGQKVKFSDVKKYSLSKGLKILQPEKLRDPVFLEELDLLNANLFIVIAFRMLPEVIWSMPEFGTFNLHASLLPQYRGAAPINHAIINGEKFSGVTTFFINDKIDTGNVIFQEKTSISENETAGELHNRLMYVGSKLVIKTIKAIETDTYTVKEQKNIHALKKIKNAPKIFKGDCRINWDKEVKHIYDFIRGLSPYPVAYGDIFINQDNYQQVRIYKARYKQIKHNMQTGTIETDNKTTIAIWAKDGKIIVDELQVSGKKRLKTEEFLNGFTLDSTSFFIK
jgi:methionyl-tRNA formyltransferase